MNESLGSILITDNKIITKKDNKIEIWKRNGNDPSNYILYNGIVYKLDDPDKKSLYDNSEL